MALFGSQRAAPSKVGCFGKLPTYGDFVSLHADAPEAQALARWMQDGVASLPVGTNVSADVCVEFLWQPPDTRRAVCGALWPSGDRAGRRFPFALFVGFPAATFAAHGPRRMTAALPVLRRFQDLHAQIQQMGVLEQQVALVRDASVPSPMEVDEAGGAFAERLRAGSLPEGSAEVLALEVCEVAGFAEGVQEGGEVADFAVRVRLVGGAEPEVEASLWMEALESHLGVADLDAAVFVRASRADRSSGAYFIHRPLHVADLGFVLAPPQRYRLGDSLGFRDAPTTPAETTFRDQFVRVLRGGDRSWQRALELASRRWTPDELATAAQDSPEPPPPASAAPALPLVSTTAPSTMASAAMAPSTVAPSSDVSSESTTSLGASRGAAPSAPAPSVAEPRTGPAAEPKTGPAPEAAGADEEITSEIVLETGGGTAPDAATLGDVTAGVTPPTAEQRPAPHVAPLRELAQYPLLRGHVVRLPRPPARPPGPGALPEPMDQLVYVEEGSPTAQLLPLHSQASRDVQARTEAHDEAVRLLDELALAHDDLEDELRSSIEAACSRRGA